MLRRIVKEWKYEKEAIREGNTKTERLKKIIARKNLKRIWNLNRINMKINID